MRSCHAVFTILLAAAVGLPCACAPPTHFPTDPEGVAAAFMTAVGDGDFTKECALRKDVFRHLSVKGLAGYTSARFAAALQDRIDREGLRTSTTRSSGKGNPIMPRTCATTSWSRVRQTTVPT